MFLLTNHIGKNNEISSRLTVQWMSQQLPRAEIESGFIQKSIYKLNISMKPTMKMIVVSSSFVM